MFLDATFATPPAGQLSTKHCRPADLTVTMFAESSPTQKTLGPRTDRGIVAEDFQKVYTLLPSGLYNVSSLDMKS